MDLGPVAFVSSALEPDSLRLVAFSGSERLNELYAYRLELVAPRPVNVSALLQAPVRVEVPTPTGLRTIAGVLSDLVVEPFAQGVRYTTTLVPRVAALEGRVRSRTFEGMCVVGLVRHVLGEVELVEGPDFRFSQALLDAEALRPRRTRPRLPEVALISQSDESDCAFLLRWLEREGVGFRFEEGPEGQECLAFFDARPEPTPAISLGDLHVIRSVHKSLPGAVIVTSNGQHELWGSAEEVSQGQGRPCRIEADAAWRTEAQAQVLSSVRREELEAWSEVLEATTSTPGVRPGDEIKAGSQCRRAIAIEHSIEQDPSHAGWTYTGRLEAIRAELSFRPARRTPWPGRAPGSASRTPLAGSQASTESASRQPDSPSKVGADPVQPPEPELVGAGAGLPLPGFGGTDRLVGVGATDGVDLWSTWLGDYAAKKDTLQSTGFEVKTGAELRAAIVAVLPSNYADFEAFEGKCTSFSGSFGGGYAATVGDSVEVAVGNTSSWARGRNSIEVSDFDNTVSKSTVGTVNEESTITGGSTSNSTITGNTNATSTQTGTATSSSVLNGNSSETTEQAGNPTSVSKVTGNPSESTTVLGNPTESLTVLGNSTATSTITGNIEETTNVIGDTRETTTISGTSNSKTTVAIANETLVAHHVLNRTSTRTQIDLGAYVARVDIAASGVDINLLVNAATIDIGLVVAKLEVAIGAWLGLTVGAGLDISIGDMMDIAIGGRTEICTSAAVEVDLSDTTVTLTGFDKALQKFLGLP